MSTFYAKYPAITSTLPAGSATAANQVLEIADLDAIKASTASIDTKLTNPLPVSGPLTDAQLRATPVPVSGTVSTNGLTDAQLRASPVPISGTVVTGGLTDTQLRATPVPVSVSSSALPSGAATETTLASFSAKSTSSDVHEAYDYRGLTYVGATQKIDVITYKTGGSGGTTVATQTFGYDGSDRLTSITKT